MSYLEEKYINSISFELPKFEQTSRQPPVFNFVCVQPGCGAGKKRIKKKAYFYLKDDHFYYKCFRCGHHQRFTNFLKEFNSSLYQEYVLENLQETKKARPERLKFTATQNATELLEERRRMEAIMALFRSVDHVPMKHPAFQYVKRRKIDPKWYHRLFVIEEAKDIAKLFPEYEEKVRGSETRLFIPCFDRDGQLVGGTCRAIDPCLELRYIAVRVHDQSELVFNLDLIELHEPVLVVEGPIDSMFLPNCIGAGGLNLKKLLKIVPRDNLTLVFDNQPKHPTVVSSMRSAISLGLPVVIWPNELPYKDINDMVLNNVEPLPIIKSHTYRDTQAGVRLELWKRC